MNRRYTILRLDVETKFLTHEPNLTHVDFANAYNANEEPVEGRLITYGIGGSARDMLRRERWSNSVAVSTIAFSEALQIRCAQWK